METSKELDARTREVARRYQGEFAWFTVLLALSIVACYVAVVAASVTGHLSLPAAAFLTVPCVYMSYTVLHEAAHGSICGKRQDLRWLNDAMGYLAAWIMMLPLTAHRHEHLAHHRNTNDPENDPDYLVSSITRSGWRVVTSVIAILISNYRYYLVHRWSKAPQGQNRRFMMELLVSFGPRIALVASGFWAEGLAIFVVGSLGGMVITMYLFAYLVHRPHESIGPYVDTSTIEAPAWCNGAVTWLWLFQNYHSVHHLFPRVPFYRYRKLFREIEPLMVAQGAPIYELRLSGLAPRRTPTLSPRTA